MGTYNSVSEMVEDLADEEFYDGFKDTLSRTTLSRLLIVMRNKEGVTQKEMAERIGCSQGKISRIENAENDDIKIGDLTAYAKVLELNIDISFSKNMTAVNAVKYHIDEMKKHLDHMADLAHKDNEIFKNVLIAYQGFAGMVKGIFKDSVDRLPKQSHRPHLEIRGPIETIEKIKEQTGEEVSVC